MCSLESLKKQIDAELESQSLIDDDWFLEDCLKNVESIIKNSKFNSKQTNNSATIEYHIELSQRLFMIDEKGKYILQQLDDKKSAKKRKVGGNVFEEPTINTIYQTLVSILNVNKLQPRIFNVLQNYLEALLFSEVYNTNTFTFENVEYELTKLYFGTHVWLQPESIQPFQLTKGPSIDSDEAMIFICFIREYESYLDEIEKYVKEKSDDYLIKCFLKICNRVRMKFKVIWDILVNVVQKDLQCNTTTPTSSQHS